MKSKADSPTAAAGSPSNRLSQPSAEAQDHCGARDGKNNQPKQTGLVKLRHCKTLKRRTAGRKGLRHRLCDTARSQTRISKCRCFTVYLEMGCRTRLLPGLARWRTECCAGDLA